MKLPFQKIITIQPVQPYDFNLTLKELDQYPLDVTERIFGHSLLRGLRLNSGARILAAISNGENNALNVDIYAQNSVDSGMVIAGITHILNLDLDLKRWYKSIESTDPMSRIISRLRGFKPIAKPTVFESLVTAILEQQLTVRFACTLETRLIHTFGEKLTCDQGVVWLFPTPEKLAKLTIEDLHTLQISKMKSSYIIDLAKMVTSGEIALNEWNRFNDDELLEHLISIRGVGRWTAEYAMLIGYRRFNLVPAADIGLRNAVSLLTGENNQPSETATREYMNRWKDFGGLATFYIWHAFSAGMIQKSGKKKR